jgi:hypothetical protein
VASLELDGRVALPKRALPENDKKVGPSVCQRRLVLEDEVEEAIWKFDPTVELEEEPVLGQVEEEGKREERVEVEMRRIRVWADSEDMVLRL